MSYAELHAFVALMIINKWISLQVQIETFRSSGTKHINKAPVQMYVYIYSHK